MIKNSQEQKEELARNIAAVVLAKRHILIVPSTDGGRECLIYFLAGDTTANHLCEDDTLIIACEGQGAFFYRFDKPLSECDFIKAKFDFEQAEDFAEVLNQSFLIWNNEFRTNAETPLVGITNAATEL